MAGGRRTAPILGLLPALLALGLLGVAGVGGAAAAPSDAEARAVFRRVTEAWAAEDARKITAAMPKDGRLRLVLRTSSVRGSYGAPQARRVLQAYFGKIGSVRLKDVTPRGHEDDRAYRVRQFQYQYVVEGEGKESTLLRITLQAEGKSGWALVAIEESSRRRSPR